MRTLSAVTFAILVLCTVTFAIRVPVNWDSASEVNDGEKLASNVHHENPIPVQYFEYPAQKPQFAVDVAKFHGVHNPEQHYTAYPVHPYTGKEKPVLGKHKILDESNPVYQPFQQFTQINSDSNAQTYPISSEYEVFHPYKAEEPALQKLYKDPVLDKIRNDIKNSQYKLQNYEKEAEHSDIEDGEYLERPEKTDRKKFPHRNIPAPYEIHRPQRRPIYYRPVPPNTRDHILNHKFRHPWNQYNAKIRPVHYRPLKHQLQRLRQHHAMKYDDEHNEYPQIPLPEQISEVPDGYDIYERGKEKYTALRNNVDESINNLVKENRPTVYQRLELQNNGDRTETQISDTEEPEFVPIKNYAQVRKTETTKHLPRVAALKDASSYDEIHNAPRLREAIKSTKAQTVYTEEGYEDAAYDHAGEEKHAAENEDHGGYLKEKEISAGKYKTPSESEKYQDASGSEYRDHNLHGKKWKNDDKDQKQQKDEEDYSEDDTAHSIEADVYDDVTGGRDKRQDEPKQNQANQEDDEEADADDKENKEKEETNKERKKRENKIGEITDSKAIFNNEYDKIDVGNKVDTLKKDFQIPRLNFSTTFLTAGELLAMKPKVQVKKHNYKEKYPYYFKDLKNINKNSPLRYAENLKFIPNKSKGGTEFYDSRSILQCPEVDDEVDAIPEKLKKDGHPDEDSKEIKDDNSDKEPKKGEADFEQLKKKQRLKGLGDKIDCFKAKYFGENPLDSPFFKEEIISNPEPLAVPTLPVHKFIATKHSKHGNNLKNVLNLSNTLKKDSTDISALLDKIKGEQQSLQDSLVKINQELRLSLAPQNVSLDSKNHQPQQTDLYTDVIHNIQSNNIKLPFNLRNDQVTHHVVEASKVIPKNISYSFYQNKEDVTKPLQLSRHRRAAPFSYEPYKIIRDVQVQESKKSAPKNNVSPLIKKLQSSRVVETVPKMPINDQPVKRNTPQHLYQSINRSPKNKKTVSVFEEPKFVDINQDQRKGEPKYELRLPNHKPEYSPVENKAAMTLQDYEVRVNKKRDAKKPSENQKQSRFVATDFSMPIESQNTTNRKLRKRRPTVKPYFDLSDLYPKSSSDFDKLAQSVSLQENIDRVPEKESNIQPVRESERIPEKDFSIRPNTPNQEKIYPQSEDDEDDDDDEEEEDEYADDGESNDGNNTEEEEEDTTKAAILTAEELKRLRKKTQTLPKGHLYLNNQNDDDTSTPKLKLLMRFNKPLKKSDQEEETESDKNDDEEEIETTPRPKYIEKKKKSSKSTLVTDTKTYGDDDNVNVKEEVDAMIGVRHNMKEYEPNYDNKPSLKQGQSHSNDDDDDDEEEEESESEEERASDESESESAEESEEEDDDEIDNKEDKNEKEEEKIEETTEPTFMDSEKLTSEAPRLKLDLMPIVHKKKMEIHKEIPVNTSAPHFTQFKQDIKEVEIIKEIPNSKYTVKKPGKHLVPLELYKDTKLAEDVNKLGAVEIFKENLDLANGPKHGGNYVELQDAKSRAKVSVEPKKTKSEDTDSSESEQLVQLKPTSVGRASNMAKFLLAGNKDSTASKQSRHKSKRTGDKSARLVELDEENEEDDSNGMHGGNYRSAQESRSNDRSSHRGNFRNARLVTEKRRGETDVSKKATAAALLNSFAQAIPILTTEPTFIMDPSKRMYYYVEV